MHIGVFDALNKVLLQKLSGDVSKKHYFSAGFLFFFHLHSKPLFSLCWPFFLLVLNFCVFFCSCCCCCFRNQVMLWFLFFVVLGFFVFFFFLSVVCVVFFGLCLASFGFFWEG